MRELFNISTLARWAVLSLCAYGLFNCFVGFVSLWTGESLSIGYGEICAMSHEGTRTEKGGFKPR
jgi:hypothetical protein